MSTKPILRLDMSDFGPELNKVKHLFYKILSRKYDVRISPEPDLLTYAPPGTDYKKYDCLRVCY